MLRRRRSAALLSAPLLALAALAIRLESPGHPIYRQRASAGTARPFDDLQAAHDGARRRAHRRGPGDRRGRRRASRASARSCAAPRSTSCRTCATCCAARCRSSARARPCRCRSTSTPSASAAGSRSSPGSPAGRRSTAARRCRGASGSSSTSGTSSTARCALDLQDPRAHRADGAHAATGLYKGETGGWRTLTPDGRPAHRRRQALRHRLRVRAAHDRRSRPTPTRSRPRSTPPTTASRRRGSTTPATCPRSQSSARAHDVGAVMPLTDLDIEVLAQARADGLLPAFVPDPEIARATYDKYETHLLLERHGPALAADGAARARRRRSLPGDGQAAAAARARARSTSPHDAERGARSSSRYVERADDGAARDGRARVLDRLPRRDLDGRCLNAIPRTMLESRGGESIKGTVIADAELIELGRRVVEALGVRGPVHRPGVPRPARSGSASPTSTRASAAPSRRRCTRRCPGRTYPELIVRMARGERIEPHVGEFRAGRHVHALLLAARARRAARADRPRDRAGRPAASAAVATQRGTSTRTRSGREPPAALIASVGVRAVRR